MSSNYKRTTIREILNNNKTIVDKNNNNINEDAIYFNDDDDADNVEDHEPINSIGQNTPKYFLNPYNQIKSNTQVDDNEEEKAQYAEEKIVLNHDRDRVETKKRRKRLKNSNVEEIELGDGVNVGMGSHGSKRRVIDDANNNNCNYLRNHRNIGVQEDVGDEENEEDFYTQNRLWNLDDKVALVNAYSSDYVKFYENGCNFTFKHIQDNGFEVPVVFKHMKGLHMIIPNNSIQDVNDIKYWVGSKRIIDVVDVNTQKGLTMTMKEWCKYYLSKEKKRLLNVISLEFSHTELDNAVQSPRIVRQLDWVETVWPKFLLNAHTDATNKLDTMKYPKVRKYVLMSVAGCFTDFHIDMGGSSVWYHVMIGEKIFWLIPPTEQNLRIYERWCLSGQQSSVFLPDLMHGCQRITIKKGWTFMMPSGWIHGVYTSKDSIVFGGNFLHSFSIPMQLRVNSIEAKTKVPSKYRYPFFNEIMWFVAERYTHCMTGMSHLCNDSETNFDHKYGYKTFEPNPNIYNGDSAAEAKDIFNLSLIEMEGLRHLFTYLTSIGEKAASKHLAQVDLLYQSFKRALDNPPTYLDIYADKDPITKEFIRYKKEKCNTGLPFLRWPKGDTKLMALYADPPNRLHKKRLLSKAKNKDGSTVKYPLNSMDIKILLKNDRASTTSASLVSHELLISSTLPTIETSQNLSRRKNEPKPIVKRFKGEKAECETSKNNEYLTVESLTSFEKDVILREFVCDDEQDEEEISIKDEITDKTVVIDEENDELII